MQNRHPGDAVAESTEKRPGAVAPHPRRKVLSFPERQRASDRERARGAATQQAGGGKRR